MHLDGRLENGSRHPADGNATAWPHQPFLRGRRQPDLETRRRKTVAEEHALAENRIYKHLSTDTIAKRLSSLKKRFVEYVQTTSSTTFLETLFGDIPLAIQLVNETGKTLFANRLFLEYFNFSSIEACTYVNVLGRHTPESYAAQLERERVRNPDEIDQTYSISIYSKNNKIRHLSVIRFMKLLDNERTTILVYIDITKSKAKNDALTIRERQHRKLFIHSPTATLLIDQVTDRLVDMNHAAEKLFNSPLNQPKKDGWQASESLTLFLDNRRFRLLFSDSYQPCPCLYYAKTLVHQGRLKSKLGIVHINQAPQQSY